MRALCGHSSYFNPTPIYLSTYMSRSVVKNGHQTDVCHKIDWTICSNYITILGLL